MKLINTLLNLIYPPKCAFCDRVLERGEVDICFACQRSLPWTEGQNFSVDFCDVSLSPLKYEGVVRRAIHHYKFGYGSAHSRVLGELMAQCLHDRWSKPADLIVWVPAARKHYRKRGYDQAELLARRVGELAGIPVMAGLEKVRDTMTQSTLKNPAERRANVLGAYAVAEGVELKGKRVVLVDDVVTSGATLSECASCLRMAGADSVVALTLACAHKK